VWEALGEPGRVVEKIRRVVTQVVGEIEPLRVHSFDFAETNVEIARITDHGSRVTGR
jgi:hypothetical protein